MRFRFQYAAHALVGATMGFCGSAQAALTINFTEVGSSVVATASGTLNVSSLTGTQSSWSPVSIGGQRVFIAGGVPNSISNLSTNYTIPGISSVIGNSNGQLRADEATGSLVGIAFNTTLVVPRDYVSGSFLQGTASWNNRNLTSAVNAGGMALIPGSYTWNWGSGADADSLTINITPIPEPATALMALAGLVGVACALKRRKA